MKKILLITLMIFTHLAQAQAKNDLTCSSQNGDEIQINYLPDNTLTAKHTGYKVGSHGDYSAAPVWLNHYYGKLINDIPGSNNYWLESVMQTEDGQLNSSGESAVLSILSHIEIVSGGAHSCGRAGCDFPPPSECTRANCNFPDDPKGHGMLLTTYKAQLTTNQGVVFFNECH